MKLCCDTGKEAHIIIKIQSIIVTEDYDLPQRLEDYVFNPQPGQTILTVIDDPTDEFAGWYIKRIGCSYCGESIYIKIVGNHFLTQSELEEKKEQ